MKEKGDLFPVQHLVETCGLVFSDVLGHLLDAAPKDPLTELYFDHVSDFQIIRGLDHPSVHRDVLVAAGVVGHTAPLDDS